MELIELSDAHTTKRHYGFVHAIRIPKQVANPAASRTKFQGLYRAMCKLYGKADKTEFRADAQLGWFAWEAHSFFYVAAKNKEMLITAAVAA